MSQPITADEGDANLSWDSQNGTSMPSPYNTTLLNAVSSAALPSLAQLQTYFKDMDAAGRTHHHRFVATV